MKCCDDARCGRLEKEKELGELPVEELLIENHKRTGEGANQAVNSRMVRCQVIESKGKVKRRPLPAGVEQRPKWIAPSLFFFRIQERAYEIIQLSSSLHLYYKYSNIYYQNYQKRNICE